METSGNSPFDAEGLSEAAETLGLKEVLVMLDEIGADEASVTGVIEAVLLEPVPDPYDDEAMAAFRKKMRIVRSAAESQLARSDLFKDIKSRIEAKIDEADRSR